MTEPDWAALDAAWLPAREAGVLGSATTEAVIAHAAGYLPAACRVEDEFSGIDLGTGAGVPGVVLAALRPRSNWTLVDASERRCHLAAAAVHALGLDERVEVVHARVDDLAADAAHRNGYDLVVARSFGPASEVAECGLPLRANHGHLVVSVTEATLRQWTGASSRLGVTVQVQRGADGARFAVIQSDAPAPERWPRRPAARRRAPLF